MPLYEYKCSACAHRFERIMKFSDAPLKTCPKCHKETIKQIISAPAIQFKGSGWYVSDYGGKNGASAAHSDGSHETAHSDGTSNGKDSAKSSDSNSSAKGSEKAATPVPASTTGSGVSATK